MTKIIRREALRGIGGGSFAALLGGTIANAASMNGLKPMIASNKTPDSVLINGCLTQDDADGRKLSGFIETGQQGGFAFCSLVRQDPSNPAVQCVFAAPESNGSMLGVRLTIEFYSDPKGSIEFNLLHYSDPAYETHKAKAIT
jgi:hypothetical protein